MKTPDWTYTGTADGDDTKRREVSTAEAPPTSPQDSR